MNEEGDFGSCAPSLKPKEEGGGYLEGKENL